MGDWGVVPWGLKYICEYIQDEYTPEGGILITENGCAVKEDDVESAKNDSFRVEFLQSYIAQVHKAIANGADVRAYFAWSLMDNFEWALGYSKRFGIVRVDYATQERTVKASAQLMSEVARTNALQLPRHLLNASNFVLIEAGVGPTKDAPPSKKESEAVEGEPKTTSS